MSHPQEPHVCRTCGYAIKPQPNGQWSHVGVDDAWREDFGGHVVVPMPEHGPV